MVSIEEGVTALGFRRIAAIARQLNPKTGIYFITPGNLYSLLTHLLPSQQRKFSEIDIKIIAKELAKTDLLCFSSMSPSAEYIIKIIQAVRKINPKVFVLWGGVHCILYPEEAIKDADAICTGEGEIPFQQFYQSFARKKSLLKTPGMWLRVNQKIIKNPNLELNTSEKLNIFPHFFYDYSCLIYDLKTQKFRQFNKSDYLNCNGLTYRTIWSIGCPYSCIYCANNAFTNLNPNYRIIRHPSVEYLIEEIEIGLKIYPFCSTVLFLDDNFIALPLELICHFAKVYKERINLPFVVIGLHPNLITKEKIEVLAKAGMNRGRMGIQSGSKKILAFYNRPTPIKNIKKSALILAKAAQKYNMIPPAYDIISDNPIETRQDIIQNLRLLYNLARPYTLTVFSLRVFPKTQLYEYFQQHPSIDIRFQTSSYLDTRQTLTNILIYLLATFKPPKIVFNFLLGHVKGYQEAQYLHHTAYWLIKSFYLTVRGISHLKRLDFTTLVGPFGYYLWKLGIIRSRFRPQAKIILQQSH